MVLRCLGILSYEVVIQERKESSCGSTPKVIGLTGGIGAGKSAVARILQDLGCVVFDADRAVRDILETDSAVREKLISWWGSEILNDEGEIDRTRVAEIVFTHPEELKRLEELLHPLVERQRVRMMEEVQHITAETGQPTAAFVIDAPLLFEAGLDEKCDVVIFVDASEVVRLERVQNTRGWSAEDLKKREKMQLPIDEKRKKSQYVIGNDGSFVKLRGKVLEVLREIIRNDQVR